VADHPGRTNDFRKLKKTLRIVAVDLDTGEAATFAAPGLDAVPISRAVAASLCAPGLYKPCESTASTHRRRRPEDRSPLARVPRTLRALAICVNPIVPLRFPITANWSAGTAEGPEARAAWRRFSTGLPRHAHSRMNYGMSRVPARDRTPISSSSKPRPEDLPRFMRTFMRTSGRIRIAEYAYRTTMQTIEVRTIPDSGGSLPDTA